MRDKLYAIMRPFDIFGLVPLMTFARAPRVYSRLSMLLSLTTLAAVVFLCIYLGLAVVQRRNPSFFQYTLPATSNDKKLMYGPETFPIRVYNYLGTLVNGDDYLWSGYAFTNFPTYKFFDFNEVYCTDKSGYMCFDQTTNVGESYITNAGTDAFEVDLITCNTFGSFGCQAQNDINYQLSLSGLYFEYTDMVVDPFDFENPLKSRPMSNNEPLMAYVKKQVTVYLQDIEVITDDGWLLENNRVQTGLSVASIQTYTFDALGDYRGNIVIKYTGNKVVYQRTYPKIQDFLAEISGIVAVIIPVIAIIAYPYAELKMREHMVNELYEVKLNRKGPKPRSSFGSGKLKNQMTPMDSKTANEPKNNSLSPNPDPNPNLRSSKIIIPSSPSAVQSLENSTVPMNRNESVIEMISPRSEMDTPKELDETKQKRHSRFLSHKLAAPSQRDESPEKPLDQKDETSSLNKQVAAGAIGLQGIIEITKKSILLNEARHTDKLNLTFGQFVRSYFKPQREIEIIKKVESDLTDAMDLATLAKKSADLDKLKAILFTPEERAIFDNLPTSVVTVGEEGKNKMVVSHYRWERSLKGDVERENQAYIRLKNLDNKTDLQKKLLGFYESQHLEDYLSEIYQNNNQQNK